MCWHCCLPCWKKKKKNPLRRQGFSVSVHDLLHCYYCSCKIVCEEDSTTATMGSRTPEGQLELWNFFLSAENHHQIKLNSHSFMCYRWACLGFYVGRVVKDYFDSIYRHYVSIKVLGSYQLSADEADDPCGHIIDPKLETLGKMERKTKAISCVACT